MHKKYFFFKFFYLFPRGVFLLQMIGSKKSNSEIESKCWNVWNGFYRSYNLFLWNKCIFFKFQIHTNRMRRTKILKMRKFSYFFVKNWKLNYNENWKIKNMFSHCEENLPQKYRTWISTGFCAQWPKWSKLECIKTKRIH